jgi:hypothetical protein
MRDDMLKEQLMSYARTAADEAAQPDAAAIRRRARRHYRRVAALTVAGVLVVAGVGVGLGLRRGDGPPTVDQPPPTLTRPGPVPSTATTRPPGETSTTRAAATGKLPGTFIGDLGGRVVEVSTAGGKVVRTLYRPQPSEVQLHAVGIAPDRTTVYYSLESPDPCAEPGVFRVPAGGGQPVRVVAGENAAGMIKVSADGSRLAYAASTCPSTGRYDIVVRDAAGAQVGRWPGASAGAGVIADRVSLSPDGRRLAIPTLREKDLTYAGVRVLDVARDRAIADGRLLKAPDPGCALVAAEFEPRSGRLAAFERCVTPVTQGLATPRFRLVYLDPGSGQLLARGFAFDDRWGSDLHVSTMDFDASGRHLLYTVTSADPFDYKEAGRPVGTWRFSGGRPVRVNDDRTVGSGQASQRLTTSNPSW